MSIINPVHRCLAEDCVRAALGGLGRKPRRFVNHRVWLDGTEREWLTLLAPDGSVRIVQHAPVLAVIGRMSPAQVSTLVAAKAHGFSGASIRGHFRSETRRKP
jgi:hypothetical protein